MQTLHIVRHGESTYNAASRSGSGFSDPQIFDPVLTEKGRRQVHSPRALVFLPLAQHMNCSCMAGVAGRRWIWRVCTSSFTFTFMLTLCFLDGKDAALCCTHATTGWNCKLQTPARVAMVEGIAAICEYCQHSAGADFSCGSRAD